MQRFSSIFSQLLQLFPRSEFEQAVRQHSAERHMRAFASWGQFIAMLFCQLGQAHSLREICGGLAATEGKLKHLGLSAAPKRSTLSYANEHRPWQLYETVFQQLLAKCHGWVAQHGGGKKFRFHNRLLSLDATVIDLCLSLYDWAQFQRTKGAVKLHLLLDHDGYLPSFAVVTTGKTPDLKVARQLKWEAGTILVFDRGYADYEWFIELSRQKVFFVTRLKKNAVYEVVERRKVPPRSAVVSDEVIYFPSHAEARREYFFRRVEVEDPDSGERLVFLTNHPKLSATTVAAIYRERWQVELFFKALKQNLRLKTFVGVSANAVRTQLFTALIAILLLRYLQLRARHGWSLSNLTALLRQQLFVYRDLWSWLDEPFEPPPQLTAMAAQLPLPLMAQG
jgi:hypothetical protein